MNINHIATLSGHKGAIYKLLLSPSSDYFYSTGGDNYIVKWDLNQPKDGSVIARAESQFFALETFPERNLLLGGCMNGDLVWINTSTQKIIKKHRLSKFAIYDIKRVNEYFYTCGADGYFTKWDPLRMSPITSVFITNKAIRRSLYVESINSFLISSSDGNIYIIKKEESQASVWFEGAHVPSVFCLETDGKHILSGGRDAKIRKTLIASPDNSMTVDAHWYTVNDLVTINDCKIMVSASRDKSIRFWDVKTMTPITTINTSNSGHINSVNSLLFVPQKGFLISGSDDQSIRIHHIEF